jgi:hypothetical protein
MTDDPFFIGWLPIPAAYRRFQAVLVALIFFSAIVLALTVAFRQRDPGLARSPVDQVCSIEGIMLAHPYAMLLVPGATPAESVTTYLLVETGKFGAVPRATPYANRFVRVTGTLLERDGRKMVELAEGDQAIQILKDRETPAVVTLPNGVIHEEVTLAGEIIDSKCYLGAMKPGGGKTHKACAMLCISGGIPPMLVTHNAAGHATYYLLTADDDGPATAIVLPYVGDQVTLTGRLKQQGDLHVLAIVAAAITRR